MSESSATASSPARRTLLVAVSVVAALSLAQSEARAQERAAVLGPELTQKFYEDMDEYLPAEIRNKRPAALWRKNARTARRYQAMVTSGQCSAALGATAWNFEALARGKMKAKDRRMTRGGLRKLLKRTTASLETVGSTCS